MLDAFIIEEIKRRKRREQEERPSIRLPLPQSPQSWPESETGGDGARDEKTPSNSVIIIDLNRDSKTYM